MRAGQAVFVAELPLSSATWPHWHPEEQPAGSPTVSPEHPPRELLPITGKTHQLPGKAEGEHSFPGGWGNMPLALYKESFLKCRYAGSRWVPSPVLPPHQCQLSHITAGLSPSISPTLLPRRAPQTVSDRRKHCSLFMVRVSGMTEMTQRGYFYSQITYHMFCTNPWIKRQQQDHFLFLSKRRHSQSRAIAGGQAWSQSGRVVT